jgi:Family of unknown function (DUF5313)
VVAVGAQARRRPGPAQWLRYALGGGLPAEYREWVLHDLTTRTWPARQLLRSLVQVLPIAVLVALVIPGELWVRIVAVLGGIAIGMIYAVAYLYESTEHRALKAGYPRGTLREMRTSADADDRAAAQRRYEERYRRDG